MTAISSARRSEYAVLLDGYLDGATSAYETVHDFFSMRTDDLDREHALRRSSRNDATEEHPDWEGIYSDLFWACEDLDSPMEEFSITEDGFREKLGDLRRRMADFEGQVAHGAAA